MEQLYSVQRCRTDCSSIVLGVERPQKPRTQQEPICAMGRTAQLLLSAKENLYND